MQSLQKKTWQQRRGDASFYDIEGRAAAVQVSLMVPWIVEADQKVLFKDHVSFKTPEDQVPLRCLSLLSVSHTAAQCGRSSLAVTCQYF